MASDFAVVDYPEISVVLEQLDSLAPKLQFLKYKGPLLSNKIRTCYHVTGFAETYFSDIFDMPTEAAVELVRYSRELVKRVDEAFYEPAKPHVKA